MTNEQQSASEPAAALAVGEFIFRALVTFASWLDLNDLLVEPKRVPEWQYKQGASIQQLRSYPELVQAFQAGKGRQAR